ncbi:hypothetical protein [Brevundimonas albigilva]|uniref:hypothetical protein n=1 Tax=Brevundimonas albigilva TaxID=1312364 RepID=UPI003221A5EF
MARARSPLAGLGRLQQLGHVPGRHQLALARDFHRPVGIGGEGPIRRAEGFALNGQHGGVDVAIGDVVHADLRIDHGLARGGEIHLGSL